MAHGIYKSDFLVISFTTPIQMMQEIEGQPYCAHVASNHRNVWWMGTPVIVVVALIAKTHHLRCRHVLLHTLKTVNFLSKLFQ